jgi:uncharacterized membrane protein
MAKKQIQWLYEELPQLVAQGVLTADAADKLRSHYGPPERATGRRWAVLLFGILGGALIGAGIILVLAHNWDDMNRPMRAAVSFLPLVTALLLAGFVLWKHASSPPWRDGVGAYWALSIGATISLVAQTYHISGDFPAFILTWSLAALPIVYILESTIAAMLFAVGITTWVGSVHWLDRNPLWFWPLLALVLPHLWIVGRSDRHRPRLGLLFWVLALCGTFAVPFCIHDYGHAIWMPICAGYYAALYLMGVLWFREGRAFWQRPLQTVGALGIVILGIILSFKGEWRHLVELSDWLALAKTPLVLLPVTAIALWGYTWKRPDPVTLLFGALPLVALLDTVLGGLGMLPAILMNLYVRDQRLGVVNFGLLVTSALIVARFFDSEMSFLFRGLAFIAVGAAFLVTNIVIIRRKGGAS